MYWCQHDWGLWYLHWYNLIIFTFLKEKYPFQSEYYLIRSYYHLETKNINAAVSDLQDSMKSFPLWRKVNSTIFQSALMYNLGKHHEATEGQATKMYQFSANFFFFFFKIISLFWQVQIEGERKWEYGTRPSTTLNWENCDLMEAHKRGYNLRITVLLIKYSGFHYYKHINSNNFKSSSNFYIQLPSKLNINYYLLSTMPFENNERYHQQGWKMQVRSAESLLQNCLVKCI